MQVPVRRLPNTQVSKRQQGFAQAGPGIDISPITNAVSSGVKVVDELRDQLKDEQRARQKLEINRRLMQEVNDLQEDFEYRKRDPELSPVDFADTTDTVYSTRHGAILDEFRKNGFDEDLIDDFDIRLGSVRQGFFERGLGHQLNTLRSRANEGLSDLGVRVSQYVAANPDGWASGESMIRETVNENPDLTEIEKEEKINELLAIVRNGGAKAVAIQQPELIIELFDPQGLTAPYRSTSAASAGTVSVAGLDEDRTAVATTLSSELPPQVVAGFLGNFDVEAGYDGAQGDGGTASGIAQWRDDRRTAFKAMFGKEPHQASKQEQAQFVLYEMQNPGRAGMTVAQRDAILAARTPEEAAELIDKFYERSNGKHRSRRIEAARKYAAVEPAPEVVTEGEAIAPTAVPQTIAEAQTGNALLDSLTGPERLQVLGWAREQQNKVLASRKAEMDVTIGNITAEALNNGGEIATPLPSQEEVLQVYGPVEGPQRWAQIQQSKDTGQAMQAFRTQSAADIQRGLAALEPRPGSPTYETELQIYQAAERAAAAIAAERDKDAAAYAMKYFPSIGEAAAKGTSHYYAELDRVYQQLGIDSRYAPVLPASATERLIADYKVMSPSQRLKYMQENFRAMGEDRFVRFTAGMEGTTAQEDARIFALMSGYRGPPGGWEAIYQQVLEGREIMAQDPARRPSQEELTKQFRLEGAQALSNLNAQASRAIQEAASALYVAKGGDPKTIDKALYKDSLAWALGGNLPADMREGAVTDFTILPSRATKKQFEAWQDSLTLERITMMSAERRPPRYGDLKTAVPIEDIIDEGVFVMTSPGRYMIKMASDGRPLMTSTGKPFLVNINPRDIP